jgi:hypothetical protein
LVTSNQTYQFIDGVCGQSKPPCGSVFTSVLEACIEAGDATTNGTIVSAIGHGISVTRCLSGGVPTDLVSASSIGQARLSLDGSPTQGTSDGKLIRNSPANCDGFGQVNLAKLAQAIHHVTEQNGITSPTGGTAEVLVGN